MPNPSEIARQEEETAGPGKRPGYEDLESALRAVAVLNAEHGRARLEAEASRDIVRAHAQACLDKYRRQDALFDDLQKLLADRVANADRFGGSEYHRGCTETLAMLLGLRDDL